MRLSASIGEPGYRADYRQFIVFIDGQKAEEQEDRLVVSADEETGEVVWCRRLEDGTVEWDGDRFVEHVTRHRVQIFRRDAF